MTARQTCRARHPDRNDQLECINARVRADLRQNEPAISVDLSDYRTTVIRSGDVPGTVALTRAIRDPSRRSTEWQGGSLESKAGRGCWRRLPQAGAVIVSIGEPYRSEATIRSSVEVCVRAHAGE
jgi:hypothetical protein